MAKVSLESLFIWRNFCVYRIKKFLAEQRLSKETYSEVGVLRDFNEICGSTDLPTSKSVSMPGGANGTL